MKQQIEKIKPLKPDVSASKLQGKKKSVSVQMVQVIQVKVWKGAGTKSAPYNLVTEYWSPDGELLAVTDSADESYDYDPFEE